VTWRVIHNPSAGRGSQIGARLRDALDRHGVDAEIEVSASPDHIEELVVSAARSGATRFAVVGGDGTAHLALNALMSLGWDAPPTLAIVPAGSGSDFIRTFALPRSLEGGVAVLAGDGVYRCDVGRIDGGFGTRWFLNVMNSGVAAASVGTAMRLPRFLGGLRYSAAFWLALPRFRPTHIDVRAGSRTIGGEALNVVVANGQFFGGGLNIAPQAAVMDGALDLQVFLGPRRRAFSIMPRVVRGLHLRHPAVLRGRAPRFELDVPQSWPVEADGELLGYGPVTVSVVPEAIDFKI
jgi:diacylglycerol kinase (ATP)